MTVTTDILKHPDSTANNITLNQDGSVTFAAAPIHPACVCTAKRVNTVQGIPHNTNTKIAFDTLINSIPGLVLTDGDTSIHNTTTDNMWVNFSFGLYIPPPDGNASWQQSYISIQTANLANEVNSSVVKAGTGAYQSINFGQNIAIPANHKLIVYFMHQMSGNTTRNTATNATAAPTLTLTYLGK